VIIGTIVPLYFHLLQNNEYFSLVSFLISVHVLLTLVQLGCFSIQKFESRVWCYCNILTILSNFLGPHAYLLYCGLELPSSTKYVCLCI
ncbi:unnamed protein product, partial [Brassica oleracea]